MNLHGRRVALFGRFEAREALKRAIEAAGGRAERDLTRGSILLVVGARSFSSAARLSERLARAEAQAAPILGERSFAAQLAGDADAGQATLPLTAIQPRPGEAETRMLAAFDLIALEDGRCRFSDAGVVKSAADLLAAGRPLAEVLEVLVRMRDEAPRGRRRLVLTQSGEAALAWDEGMTSLEGQGLLPLPSETPSLEDLFEQALTAEAEGEGAEAIRLYDLVARADPDDAISPYNLGNLRLAQGDGAAAALAYRRALSRDAGLAEAHYNLSLALERLDRADEAEAALEAALAADPAFADALFNLARLRVAAGRPGDARELFLRYLATDPPEGPAKLARRALMLSSGSSS